MRARKGLAGCLYAMGRYDEAISHFKEMLRLNPNDNQGNRDVLAACYLSASRNSDALDLLNKYPEDGFTVFLRKRTKRSKLRWRTILTFLNIFED